MGPAWQRGGEENWAAARQAGRARASAWRWAERGRKKGLGWATRESVARPRGADLRAARDAGRGERGRRWAALGHAGGKGRGGGLGRFGLLFSGFGWAGFWVPSLISISYLLSNSTQLFEFKNNFEFKHLCTQTNKTNASACMHKQVSPKNKF